MPRDDPKEVGPVDVVLFAVKLWDTETAAELAKPLVGPNTRVITLQNGVDSYERVSAHSRQGATCPGTAYIAAVLGGPGVMRHTSKFATMRVGRMDGKPDAKLAAFVDAAKAANIDIQPQDDMNRERWQKFIFLSSMAGVNCMMREPIGKVLADPDTRAFYKKLMQECLAVGQKSGAKVPDRWIDDRMTFSDNAPPGMKASMCTTSKPATGSSSTGSPARWCRSARNSACRRRGARRSTPRSSCTAWAAAELRDQIDRAGPGLIAVGLRHANVYRQVGAAAAASPYDRA